MSEFITCETVYTDEGLLKEALVDLGIALEQIEVHAEGAELVGYQGDQRIQKAHVIVRRQHVGSASNDIGFEKQADGTYKAIVSEYDKNFGYGNKILSKSAGGSGELDQQYAKRGILRTISRNYRHKLKTCEKQNGKIRIKVTVQ